LAAGEGKRMKSKLPKVLHKLANRPIIKYSFEVVKNTKPAQIIVVSSPDSVDKLKMLLEGADFVIQRKALGTADATLQAIKKIRSDIKTTLVVYGADLAFFNSETLNRVIKQHLQTNSVQTLVTANISNPTGCGRIIRDKGQIVDIVEEKDATDSIRKIKEVNVGIYVFDKGFLAQNLTKVKPSPVSGEKYLVDLVKIAAKTGEKTRTYALKDTDQWFMIDTPNDLKLASQKLAKRVHIMGIAGAGASAVAQIAKGNGYKVSGCDINSRSSYLKGPKLEIKKGHDSSHIHNIGMLIVSPAIIKYDPKNGELKEAKRQKIPVVTWQQFQGQILQKNKFVIAVAGAYGKSTTTALLSQILIDAGLDPTCEIGATVLSWGTNYKVGNSKYYVCEADEYNDNFLNYNPDIAVVLSMSWDHPDYFKTKEKVFDSFEQFINKIKNNGVLVIAQDPSLEKLAKLARSDIKIAIIRNYDNYKLSIIGDFRRENANAALTVAKILEINSLLAMQSIQNFSGVARRLEFKGKVDNVRVYDDYAVQPYTVLTTANALKEKFKNSKVVLVFEPHTFSRINIFFDDFVKNLKKCRIDKILITEVYPAREKGNKKEVAAKLAKAIGHKATFTGSIIDTANYLKKSLKAYDVICSMGAGNAYKLYDTLISLL